MISSLSCPAICTSISCYLSFLMTVFISVSLLTTSPTPFSCFLPCQQSAFNNFSLYFYFFFLIFILSFTFLSLLHFVHAFALLLLLLFLLMTLSPYHQHFPSLLFYGLPHFLLHLPSWLGFPRVHGSSESKCVSPPMPGPGK